MLERKLCPVCDVRYVCVANIRNGKTYYRNRCSVCYKAGKKIKPKPPFWMKSGYKKKDKCERCGFKAKVTEQLNVVYVDGNDHNNDWFNLRTVCLNCQAEVMHSGLSWKPSALTPDL